jgi:hypothetical protein
VSSSVKCRKNVATLGTAISAPADVRLNLEDKAAYHSPIYAYAL